MLTVSGSVAFTASAQVRNCALKPFAAAAMVFRGDRDLTATPRTTAMSARRVMLPYVAMSEKQNKLPVVRAKFSCGHIADGRVVMSPVYSGSEENEQFFRATPCGLIDLQVVNPTALAAFQPGKEYYVDFTPAS